MSSLGWPSDVKRMECVLSDLFRFLEGWLRLTEPGSMLVSMNKNVKSFERKVIRQNLITISYNC